ncbi:MAG TPA: glycosyl hydrolase [Burkholderiales bacterium]|nr:glycosyl hydrolase [Burkholderiales bacterium]
MTIRIVMGWLSAIALGLAATTAGAAETVTLRHVHGLGYSPDGSRLMLPSHDGLAVYSGGRWSKAPGPQHDYMGFAVTREFIFSSGHPAPGTGLANPFGLIRSRDGGQSWSKLGLEGEADFHALAAGYANNAVYVYSPTPNSRMPRPGLYKMIGQGLGWRSADGRGLRGEIHALAVHPTEAGTLAATTSAGVFLSRNGGDEFQPIVEGAQALAACFTLDGDSLWFSVFDGKPGLSRVTLGNGSREEIALPSLGRDAVAYIAQNPARPAEFAIATFERSVFLTSDAGKTWRPIAERGATR